MNGSWIKGKHYFSLAVWLKKSTVGVHKNWCFRILVLENSLESPLDSKDIKPVNPKGNQPWILIGRTDAKAEAPILWPPDVKSWLIGKNWCWERLKAKGEKGSRGWDGWVSSPIQWTCTWVNSGRCWETGKPGVLQSMGPQKLSYWRTTKTLISE